MIVLDSGAVSVLAERTSRSSLLLKLIGMRDWPATVPSVVLVECLTGDYRRDSHTNRFLKTCNIVEGLSEVTARAAAQLRYRAERGSAVDAIVVALAAGGGTVVTSDVGDLSALAANADTVSIMAV